MLIENAQEIYNFPKEYFLTGLSVCACNESENQEYLKDVPVVHFFDLALYLRYYTQSLYSIRITNETLEHFGVSFADAFYYAKQRMKKQASVRKFNDFMYIATTKTVAWGAGVICDTDIIKRIAEKENMKKVCVFPSSIHEIIIACIEPCAEMLDVVKALNSTIINPEDKLTDNVYVYDAELDDLTEL